MNLKEYASFDAVGLAERIRSGEVSVDEVVACAKSALELADERLNCMVEIYNQPWSRPDDTSGALHGVPFVYKDAGAHEDGVRQEVGSRLGAGLPAAGDTEYARRAKALGLLNLGRTTTSELAYATVTETSACGATLNPWNTEHSPGGSSGGSAAAVACGAVPIAHATDGGGSIRAPAAWTGLIGLKPSRGRISLAPGAGETLLGMAGEFALCRSVRDAVTLLDGLQGHAPGDPVTIRHLALNEQAIGHVERTDMKIGLVTTAWTGQTEIDQECRQAAEDTARRLEARGAHVEPTEFSIDGDALVSAVTDVWCGQLALLIDHVVAATGRDPEQHLDRALYACYRHGRDVTAAAVFTAIAMFNAISRTVGQAIQTYDAVITPATATPAPRIGSLDATRFEGDAVAWTQAVFAPVPHLATFNITGAPAISIPTAFHGSGLPIGTQLVAPHGREDVLLRMASFLEQDGAMPDTRPAFWVGDH